MICKALSKTQKPNELREIVLNKHFCRCCKNNIDNTLLEAKDMFLGSRDRFSYVYCKKCLSLSIAKVPENICDYYSGYYSFREAKIKSKLSFSDAIKRKILKKKSLLSKYLLSFFYKENDLRIKALAQMPLPNKKIKILDVGSGSGDLVCELYSLGYSNIEGIDPFLEKDIVYNEGLKIQKKALNEVDSKYDLIMFHHTFEHMPDPESVAKDIRSKLTQQGVCIIRIPNVSSYAFKLFKQNWFGIHAPFHYALPSISAFHNIMDKNGLKITNIAGENLVEFFLYSCCHGLDICDYEEFGGRKRIKIKRAQPSHPIFSKREISFWKEKTKEVLKFPYLCDWITYYIKIK